MSDQLPANDEQLELKKRARRRLIGAVVFATVAAVVLPMVMDAEPPAALPTIELRIPAQDKGFVPPAGKAAPASAAVTIAPPVSEPVAPVAAPAVAVPEAAVAVNEVPAAPVAETKPKAKVEVNPKLAGKSTQTSTPTSTQTPPSTPTPKLASAAQAAEAKRAQAILAGHSAPPAADGPHVVLIGAFGNAGNVDNLKKKIGEMGIKVFTEPLTTPQGKKIRVRAGPFPNREAAEKALARLKSIGVNGIVAAKS